MRPVLALNHAFLEGMARRPAAMATGALIELAATVRLAQSIYDDGGVHVGADVCGVDVGGGERFDAWYQRSYRNPEWAVHAQLLVSLLQGPFVTNLAVDAFPPPVATTPSIAAAPPWLREIVLWLAHHGLSTAASGWLLSYGAQAHLNATTYSATRAVLTTTLWNHSTHGAAATALRTAASASLQSTREILDVAAAQCRSVVVTPEARKYADRFPTPSHPTVVFDAIVGLDALAHALEQGLPPLSAMAAYQQASGVAMTPETPTTMRQPTKQAQRTATLLDGSTRAFDWHAKPFDVRIYVHTERVLRDPSDPSKGKKVIVYVGRCGEHP